jgi:hypothetical protein
LIVNVPIAEDGTHEQYVMNTITKSWCKFKELERRRLRRLQQGALFHDRHDGGYKAWTGDVDNGDQHRRLREDGVLATSGARRA